MQKRIFVDMDGVLARFYDEVKYLERMWENGFFMSLKPYDNVISFVKTCVKNLPDAEVFILSAYNAGSPAMEEKDRWLDIFLPEIPAQNRIYVTVGNSKAAAVPRGITKNDYLIDDYTKNLVEWEKAGGTGIKFINNVNGKGLVGPEWEGDRLNHDDTVTASCLGLSKILGISTDWAL